MKVIYESNTIEQIFNLLNSLVVQGIQNNQAITNISMLLQQNEIEDEKDDMNDNC